MKEKIKKQLTIKELQQIKSGKVLLRELSKNPEFTDKIIKAYKENIKGIERALRDNVEWPSEKQRLKTILANIKEKKGLFSKPFIKYGEHRLKKITDKPPKKLNKGTREFLEKEIKRYRRIIAVWEGYKKDIRKKN